MKGADSMGVAVLTNETVAEILKAAKVGDQAYVYFLDGGDCGGVVSDIKTIQRGHLVIRFTNGNMIHCGSLFRKAIKVTVGEDWRCLYPWGGTFG